MAESTEEMSEAMLNEWKLQVVLALIRSLGGDTTVKVSRVDYSVQEAEKIKVCGGNNIQVGDSIVTMTMTIEQPSQHFVENITDEEGKDLIESLKKQILVHKL